MSINNKINGVIRNISNVSLKVNGVWRNNINGLTRVNGVWRNSYNGFIDSKDIIGFKLIYTLNKSRIHYDNKRLKYNSKIPYIFKLTGDNIGSMDFSTKGVVFEYMRDEPNEEGIIMYEGRLYAILNNNDTVNVCNIIGNNNNKNSEDEIISEFSNSIYEVGKFGNTDIKLYGYVLFEDYGYYFSGWNNLFNTKAFIDKTIYPDKFLYKKALNLNSYNILPFDKRDKYFDSVASIGIARDMKTSIYNMTGSHGILDHTITKISLNGIDMPFIIEIK